MTDLITYVTRMPERGETLEAMRFASAPGGKGANQAVAARLLGSEVALIACVGDDAFGTAALENLRCRDIDAHRVRVVAGVPSGVAPIFVEPSGENRILIVHGANDALTPGDIRGARASISACDVLVLQLEVPLETVYAALELGVALAKCVILNPAPATPALDLAKLRECTYLVPNQSELALLTGAPAATLDEASRAAQTLVARGVERVIVTLGAGGAVFVDARRVEHVPGVAVDAIDTTGAGDAFIGAFAHALANGKDVMSAIAAAVRYAALSVTRQGTQTSFATRDEIAAFEAAR